MAKKQMISTRFWDDGWVVGLDPIEKLLFLYLITSPLAGLTGCYELSLRRAAFDTGIDESAIKNIFKRFVKDKKIAYLDGWVIVVNYQEHNSFRGEKLEMAIKNEVKLFPDRVSIEYRQCIDRYNSNSNRNSNVNSNKSKSIVVKEFGTPEINEVTAHFEKKIGEFTRKKLNRYAAKRLIDKHGVKGVAGAINYAAQVRGQQYAPQITSFLELEDKWLKLEAHAGKGVKKQQSDKELKEFIENA